MLSLKCCKTWKAGFKTRDIIQTNFFLKRLCTDLSGSKNGTRLDSMVGCRGTGDNLCVLIPATS